jgi:hypothetical protein
MRVPAITEHLSGVTNAPSLTVTKPTNNTVQLIATGPTNLRYAFESSTDLAQWTMIAVRTNLTGAVDHTPAASSSPRQFYRVVVP